MAKRRKGKPRKPTNKNVPAKGRLRDMADRLWSLAVRDDWGWKCAVCGYEKTEAHHLIPRQHESTRYLLRNGIALCSRHHQFDPDKAPHQNAAGWLLWLHDSNPRLHAWYTETVSTGEYRSLGGTKNADYYCRMIAGLKQHVSEKDFREIVGVKFSQWLEENHE